MKKLVASAAALCLSLSTSAALAHGPYIELRDDGSMKKQITSPTGPQREVLKGWIASGLPMPDILSVWTNFSMDENDFETLFLMQSNDATHIGLDAYYGGDGTQKSINRPLKSILLHNNVTALAKRAQLEEADGDLTAFAQYLFLLELSHNWGPAIKVPPAVGDGGAGPGELIGFDFHWSFFLDPGGPAGGNAWKDNGDGTFTIANHSPKGLKYSMLDLYLMGLADKSEVSPFGVLENVVVPTDFTDPFFKGGYSSQSFPYFGAKPFTVTATKRTLTIDDVVSANGGERAPGVASSQKGFTLGVVLMLDQDSSDADVATAEAALDPVAASLPDAFANATAHRGTMTLVAPADDSDAGTPDLDAGTNGASASPSSPDDGGGCNLANEPSTSAWPIALGGLAIGLAALVRRRRGR